MKVGDIVEVSWLDAWADADESKPADWRESCPVRTVGMVARLTDGAVSIAGEWFPDDPNTFRNVTHIPRAMIVGRPRRLR
jgi:hypothetical protein